MRRKLFRSGFFLLIFLGSIALASCAGRSETSRLVRAQFREGFVVTLHPEGAPFPQERRRDGYTYEDTEYSFREHYDDSTVKVFFPGNWKENGPVNLVFFFHGWFSSISDEITRFHLLSQFRESRVNALLVLPETAKDAPDSFGGKLEYRDGFRTLVEEVMHSLHQAGLVGTEKVNHIVLAGHSGAYHVISQILSRGGLTSHIKDVMLFDALYGDLEDFAQWVASRQGHLYSVFTQDSDTIGYNFSLIDDLAREGVPLLLEEEKEEDRLPPHGVRAVFYRSRLDHYQVVDAESQFEKLLKTACR